MALAGDIGARIVLGHATVTGTNFDTYGFVKIVVQIDGHLVPRQVDVATVGAASLQAGAADIEGGIIGGAGGRGGTYVTERVSTNTLPSISTHFAFNLDGKFGVLGNAVKSVLQRKGIPDENKRVLGADFELVAEHLSFVPTAVVAQSDRTCERGVGGQIGKPV